MTDIKRTVDGEVEVGLDTKNGLVVVKIPGQAGFGIEPDHATEWGLNLIRAAALVEAFRNGVATKKEKLH